MMAKIRKSLNLSEVLEQKPLVSLGVKNLPKIAISPMLFKINYNFHIHKKIQDVGRNLEKSNIFQRS